MCAIDWSIDCSVNKYQLKLCELYKCNQFDACFNFKKLLKIWYFHSNIIVMSTLWLITNTFYWNFRQLTNGLKSPLKVQKRPGTRFFMFIPASTCLFIELMLIWYRFKKMKLIVRLNLYAQAIYLHVDGSREIISIVIWLESEKMKTIWEWR